MATAIQVSRAESDRDSWSGKSDDSKNKSQEFKILVKMVPPDMKNEDVKVILEKYGRITSINGPIINSGTSKFPYRFAECGDEKSMQAIIEGMSKDKSGIKAEKKRPPNNSNKIQNESNQQRELSNRIGKFRNIDQNDSKQYGRLNQNQHQSNNYRRSNDSQKENYVHQSPLKFEDVQKSFNHVLPKVKPYEMVSSKVYHCFYCGRTATMCCQRCEEIYCSRECQDNDWAKHKYSCFKKPLLINIPNLNTLKIAEKTERPIEINVCKNDLSVSTSKKIQPIEYKSRKSQDSVEKFIVDQVKPQLTEKKLSKVIVDLSKIERKTTTSDCGNVSTNKTDSIENKEQENKIFIPKVIEKAPFPLSGKQVILTHLDKLNCVFLRSNEKSEMEDYVKTITFVENSARESNTLSVLPKVKDMVLSQFEGGWYRALVLNPQNENNILVAYIDFGNAENKKLVDLKEMHPDCYNFKRYPHCVTLKDIPKMELDDVKLECKNYIQSLIDNVVPLKIEYKNEIEKDVIKTVELFDYQNNSNINQKLKKFLSPPPINTGKSIFLKDLVFNKLPNSNNTELIILDNSFIDAGFVTCILADYINLLEESVEKFLESASKDSNPYEPLESELCIVKVSDNPETWYRASCESVLENDRLELLLTDFGNVCDVSIKNVRKYPNDLNIPCYSNICFIKGFQTAADNGINNETKSKLVDLLKRHDILVIPKVELINEENFIHLPKNIIDTIKEKRIINFNDNE